MNDLEHELRRVVRGDVRFDPASRLLYSTDASMYQMEPIGVVIPRDAERAGDLDRRLDVVGIARDDDADGLDLVHGGVGRIEEAGSRIEADVPADSLAELALEVGHADIILGGREWIATGTIVA